MLTNHIIVIIIYTFIIDIYRYAQSYTIHILCVVRTQIVTSNMSLLVPHEDYTIFKIINLTKWFFTLNRNITNNHVLIYKTYGIL